MAFNYQGTRISEPPTYAGVAGEAWRLRLAPVGQRGHADSDGTVGGFLVHARGAHPVWDHYAVSVIHLRPIANVKPATITKPGATHELAILSLNPEEPLPNSLDVGPDWKLKFLTPVDVVEQFTAADDAVADQILDLAVRAIVDGHLSPDQDWRSVWKQSIAETAAHFADGTHGLPRS